MIISKSNKFIYSAIGGTGTTNMMENLKNYHDTDVYLAYPRHACMFELEDQINLDDFYKFCFCRNPYDLVARNFCFFGHKVKYGKDIRSIHLKDAKERFKEFVFSNDVYNQNHHHSRSVLMKKGVGAHGRTLRYPRHGSHGPPRFQFVKEGDEEAWLKSSSNSWCHPGYLLRYVSDMIMSRDGKTLLVDEIFRFEDLANEKKRLSEKLCISINSKIHKNTTSKPRGCESYSDIYDEESRRKVYNDLERDFQIFGYSSEIR